MNFKIAKCCENCRLKSQSNCALCRILNAKIDKIEDDIRSGKFTAKK